MKTKYKTNYKNKFIRFYDRFKSKMGERQRFYFKSFISEMIKTKDIIRSGFLMICPNILVKDECLCSRFRHYFVYSVRVSVTPDNPEPEWLTYKKKHDLELYRKSFLLSIFINRDDMPRAKFSRSRLLSNQEIKFFKAKYGLKEFYIRVKNRFKQMRYFSSADQTQAFIDEPYILCVHGFRNDNKNLKFSLYKRFKSKEEVDKFIYFLNHQFLTIDILLENMKNYGFYDDKKNVEIYNAK